MKRTSSLYLPAFLALSAAVGLSCGAKTQSDAASKVLNGDFETRSATGAIAGWTLPEGTQVLEEGGNHFVRLQQAQAGNGWLSQKVPLSPEWSRVKISGRVRLSGLRKGDADYKTARLQFNFEDAKGQRVGDWPLMPTLNDNTDWKEVSVEADVPDGATAIALWPGFMESAGTLDVDDLQVMPVAGEAGGPFRGKWPPGGASFLWDGKMPSIPERAVQKTLVVDGSSPRASDSNDGSAGKPFKTIAAAVRSALQMKKQNIGARVLVQPGLYRETVLDEPGYGNPDSDTDAPLVIEAASKGKVIVSGADRWSNWKARKAGVWTHPWKFKWGVAKNPWGTTVAAVGSEGKQQILTIEMNDVVRRAEAVFGAGKVLRQVLAAKDLKPGTFFVDEAAEVLTVQLAAGQQPQNLEVATRNTLFKATGRKNLVVRGIEFRHCANGVGRGTTFDISNSQNVLIEDCAMNWNSYSGFALGGGLSKYITLRNVRANHNGYGNGSAQGSFLRLENIETSYNNWRGDWGGFYGWDVAGIKMLDTHHAVIKGYRSVGNKCAGFWLDWNNSDILIENAFWARNKGSGVFFEISQGPITLRDSVLAFNDESGVFTANCNNVTLERCTLMGNRLSQFEIGHHFDREVEDFRSGWKKILQAQYYTIKDCVFVAGGTGSSLFNVPAWEHFLTTLTSSRNLWFDPNTPNSFRIGGVGFELADWRKITGQGTSSVFADPKLTKAQATSPRAADFAPSTGSPLLKRASWPQRPATTPDMKYFAQRRGELVKALNGGGPGVKPFPLAANVKAQAWQKLSLAPFANRALVGEGGSWIGIPNPYIKPGPHTFYGVPFQVLNQAENNRRAVVALASKRVEFDVDGKPLPQQVTIPVGRKARGVYVLHGAGYVSDHTKAARYSLVYEDGTQSPLDITTFGTGTGQKDPDEALARTSNLQDWWSSFPHFENPSTRHVLLLNDADPLQPPVYLYVLEWKNPHPEKPIREIRLKSPGNVDASVLVLGVTLAP
jgi:hypothetical protein